MNKYIANLLLGLFSCFIFVSTTHAQSAVYIYKNPKTGEGDYMFTYGVPTIEDAEFLAQEKLIELGYTEDMIRKQASTKNKGYGLIIKSVLENKYGRRITVFGVALGCKTKEQAQREALENLKKYNPEWGGGKHTVVQRFIDR
ncbi:MAG: hypothetical protein ACPGJS_10290 [Flammeovirgaceae bacterium]